MRWRATRSRSLDALRGAPVPATVMRSGMYGRRPKCVSFGEEEIALVYGALVRRRIDIGKPSLVWRTFCSKEVSSLKDR